MPKPKREVPDYWPGEDEHGNSLPISNEDKARIRSLWESGCEDPFPLIGVKPDVIRCRLCNVHAPDPQMW